MKIYYRNKTAKLKLSVLYATCIKCPFYIGVPCPFGTGTTIDCINKGWWVDGESTEIFKL